MVERQRLTTGLFANLGANSPQPEEIVTPMEFHSDALTADDLPSNASRTTPLKALAAMGPMDMFLGSSPTPHARKTTKHVVSDNTSVATPTAVRTRQVVMEDNLGSSPPRFEKDANSIAGQSGGGVQVGSSFDYHQPEPSFDEGTTIDEEALLAAELEYNRSDLDLPDDTIMSELPSSTIDLQLTAQIDADMQAHVADTAQPAEEAAPETDNVFVDAASHQLPTHDASDTEVDESQPSSQAAFVQREDRTSSTSRVGDSFSKSSPEEATPKANTLRRSSRHSLDSTPVQPSSGKKRKQTPGRKGKKERAQEKNRPVHEVARPDDDGMLDNIVVASPKKTGSAKKRKSAADALAIVEARTLVPETNRKRGIRRSQSSLSQVENSQDVLVEDSPAPKRARQSLNKDVSDAKSTPPPSKESQTKRLSHVQVTPKSSTRGTSVIAAQEPAIENNDSGAPTIIEDHSPSQPHPASASVSTPSRSFTERVILTPRSIINQLKSLKDYLFSAPQLVLGRDEEREIDDVMYDIRRQVTAAGLRSEAKRQE